MGENPGASAVLPQPASGGAGKAVRSPWNDQSILGLLLDALRKECGNECCDCDLEVRDRVAYLRGTVSGLAHKLALARAVMNVPGLRAVVNQLRVTPLSPRSDQHIASDVRSAMIKSGLGARMPAVNVIDGVVYLAGSVGSPEARSIAEDAAWSAPGVEQVVSDIQSTTPRPKKDQEVLTDVELTLSRYLGSGSKMVHAEVRKGVVYLRGDVDSAYQSLLTENAVAWTPSVVDVVNELIVTSCRPN